MRRTYTDMIKRNLKLFCPDLSATDDSGRGLMAEVKKALQDYRERLDYGDQKFIDRINLKIHEKPEEPGQIKWLTVDGFMVKNNENIVDILNFWGKGHPLVRPNIQTQETATSVFIHWATKAMVLERESGYVKIGEDKYRRGTEAAQLAHRIYLNPKSEDNGRIFETIMTELNTAGLAAHGKVHDRSLELCNKKEPCEIRADGIMIAVGERDAQAVLDVVLGVWEKEKDSFAGRDTPFVPLRIGDGIAIGAEPPSHNSLTSEIADICKEAVSAAEQTLGINIRSLNGAPLPEAIIPAFRNSLAELATEKGMNPDNLAFRLVQETAAESEQSVSTPNASTPPVAKRPNPSAARRAHENAMREARSTGPTGDPDEEARQGRY
jgi:hypothetical protein